MLRPQSAAEAVDRLYDLRVRRERIQAALQALSLAHIRSQDPPNTPLSGITLTVPAPRDDPDTVTPRARIGPRAPFVSLQHLPARPSRLRVVAALPTQPSAALTVRESNAFRCFKLVAVACGRVGRETVRTARLCNRTAAGPSHTVAGGRRREVRFDF